MKMVAIALLFAATSARQEEKKADELFKQALAQAKEANKKVFLTFGSPG